MFFVIKLRYEENGSVKAKKTKEAATGKAQNMPK